MRNDKLNKMTVKTLLASSLLLGGAGVTTLSNAWADAGSEPEQAKHCDDKHGKFAKHQDKHGQYQSEKHSAKMLSRLDRELDLSSEQYGKVASLIKAQADKRAAEREQMHAAFNKMRSLSPASDDYLQQASALASEQAQAMSEHMVDRAKLKADIYAVLTPEQQSRFVELKRERGERDWQRKSDH